MPGWIKPVFWIIVIAATCYAMNIHPMAVLDGIGNALHQMHDTNAGNP